MFAAALEREGIPCDGRFYEPVYRSDLLYAMPENCPQLKADYRAVRCPVSERAAYEETLWLPQVVLIGEERGMEDIARGGKFMANRELPARQDASIAGVNVMVARRGPDSSGGRITEPEPAH